MSAIDRHRSPAAPGRVRRWSSSPWSPRCSSCCLFGIIEAGRFIFYYETLNNATREGARYAIVNGANTHRLSDRPAGTRKHAVRSDRERRQGTRRNAAFGVLSTASRSTPDLVLPTTVEASTVTVSADASRIATLVPLVPLPPITDQCGVEPCRQQLSRTRERGQVLVLFAGGLVALLLVAALAFDVGIDARRAPGPAECCRRRRARRRPLRAQLDPADARIAARQLALDNGFDDAAADEVVNIYIPAIHGRYAGLPGLHRGPDRCAAAVDLRRDHRPGYVAGRRLRRRDQ